MMLFGRKLLRFHVYRLLLAAEGTIPHDAFAHDVSGHFDRALAGRKRLQAGRRDLRRIIDLQIKRAERNQH